MVGSFTTQRPLSTSFLSAPVRFKATRCPSCAESTSRSCTWMLRIRTSSPISLLEAPFREEGSITTVSSVRSSPDQRVPVTTVPMPFRAVSYTHLRAHETDSYLVCRLLLEKKKTKYNHITRLL